MRRIIPLLLLAFTVTAATASTASADRSRRGRHERRVKVRDHRNHRPVVRRDYRRHDRRTYRRDRRAYRPARRVVDRRPVYVRNNRYVFRNGRSFVYRRPVIRRRYFNVRVRPPLLIEHYETVPGYIWVAGRWNWNGYEWIWIAGHYQIDPRYSGSDAYYYSY